MKYANLTKKFKKFIVWLLFICFLLGLIVSSGLLPDAWFKSAPSWMVAFLLFCISIVIIDAFWKTIEYFIYQNDKDNDNDDIT